LDLNSLRNALSEKRLRTFLRERIQSRDYLHGVPYWIAGLSVGFAAVIYSGLFTMMIESAQKFSGEHPYWFLVVSPLLFVSSVLIVDRISPSAAGTGVPAVGKAVHLGGLFGEGPVESLVGMRTALAVALSSLIATLGGGGMGREGPMVHIAACLFYFIGARTRAIWPHADPRSWIIAGGAAGVAAAFNTPLAGIVFALEEIASQQFHQVKTIIMSSVIVAGMVAQWLSGRYLPLGFPPLNPIFAHDMLWVFLVAIFTGAVSGLFLRLLQVLEPKARAARAKIGFLFVILVAVVVAALASFISPHTIGGGIKLIGLLLFDDSEHASWLLLGARFLSTLLTHITGVAGGFLAPSLTLGALVGSKFSSLLAPELHNLLVLTGMAGALAAITRAPFTAMVIVMEMTDRHSAIFPLMLASVVSVGAARLIRGKIERYI
jgi:H+/Cl- antiporter ClcA